MDRGCTKALRCNAPALVKMDECQRELTPAGEAWPPASLYRNLSSCREKLYSRRPYETRCPSLNVTIHFEWKARMWCDYDARFLQRVARAAIELFKVELIIEVLQHVDTVLREI